MFIFANNGPIIMAVISSVPKPLMGQANAVSVFFIHLLGDFPSPIIGGWLNDTIGLVNSLRVLISWLTLASLWWGVSWILSNRWVKRIDEDDMELPIPLIEITERKL
jgi:hypothetical protein